MNPLSRDDPLYLAREHLNEAIICQERLDDTPEARTSPRHALMRTEIEAAHALLHDLCARLARERCAALTFAASICAMILD